MRRARKHVVRYQMHIPQATNRIWPTLPIAHRVVEFWVVAAPSGVSGRCEARKASPALIAHEVPTAAIHINLIAGGSTARWTSRRNRGSTRNRIFFHCFGPPMTSMSPYSSSGIAYRTEKTAIAAS